MSESAHFDDPFFVAITSAAFQRSQIADLAAGRCVAIRVPEFLSPAVCQAVLDALTAASFDSYGAARVHPPVMRFGVGVSDYRRNGQMADDYWPAVAAGRDAWASLGLSFDPFELCRDGLAAHWPNKVEVGRHGGQEMGAGVAREPNQGFQVHFDDALREFTGNLLDENLVAQFAFNLYLSVPPEGGQTVVWRHLWHPADEQFRIAGSYGYSEAVVGDAQSFALTPTVGEALLFNPRYFHAVRPSFGSRRIALGFAVGMSDGGELFTWG